MAKVAQSVVTQILNQFKTLDNETLCYLNKVLCAQIRAGFTETQQEAATQFKVGQHVEFTGRGGQVIKGIVEKINTKTIGGRMLDGLGRWRCSPTLLRASKSAAPVAANKKPKQKSFSEMREDAYQRRREQAAEIKMNRLSVQRRHSS